MKRKILDLSIKHKKRYAQKKPDDRISIKHLLIALTLLITISTNALASDEATLVNGVTSIYFEGVPSSLWALNSIPIPIAAGDDDTTPRPSLMVTSSSIGNGRVIAVGSDGFVSNNVINLFDNKKFGNNVVDWLDKQGRKKILISMSHGEGYGGDHISLFKSELQSRGYTIYYQYTPITSADLSDKGVLLIGNAQQTPTVAEMSAISNYVSNGGGLLLVGLGWSWEPYHPGKTLDDYPINQIGQAYGVRWIGGYISDTTNNYNGGPIFHTFYPNIELQTVDQAFTYLNLITSSHVGDLPALLQIDANIRNKYLRATQILATGGSDLGPTCSQRQDIYNFYKTFFSSYPTLYQKNRVYNKNTESTIAQIRERAYSTLISTQLYGDGLSTSEKTEIAGAMALSGRYLDIWNRFSVLLLDNSQLSSRQKDFLYSFLDLLPRDIHNLHTISVLDFLGALPDAMLNLNIWTKDGGVNIFGAEIGTVSGNPFPGDISPVTDDLFCSATAHEVGHIVDAYNNQKSSKYAARIADVISRADCPHMNYLRSMFSDCLFKSAPQEFFASIANQYFSDSYHTLDLGVIRFQNGYKEPINQFLFYADTYSQGSDHTYFYKIDAQGIIQREAIALERDGNGYIKALICSGKRYDITLDAQGYVQGISVGPASMWQPLGGLVNRNPSAIKDGQGRRHVFVSGGDNALWENVDGEWTPQGGFITSAPFAAKDSIGRIHVLVRGGDNSLWDRIIDLSPGGTAQWKYLGGVLAASSTPTAAMVPGSSIMRIAVRGSDNSLWACNLNIDTLAYSWEGRGGLLSSDPFLIFDNLGQKHELVRGGDGSVWDNKGVLSGGVWSHSWNYLGGFLMAGSRPAASTLTGSSDHLAVVVRGGDNGLWISDLNVATNPETFVWHGELGGSITSDPYPIRDSGGAVHIFARGSDFALWENVCNPWSLVGNRWFGHGGGLAQENPVAIVEALTRTYVVGNDNSVWQKIHTTSIATLPG